ncbi:MULTISPECIES: YncE family protein [Mesobacillus]|uniref:WD40 repeat domain-containing protein n=1 Tax=Mesobacillus selenatarsenatis TaxID=388741 RepID=A0A846U0D9_9BACI|nr:MULTISPECIES: WD40 repeat domain-containing protein [Mesobacillus]NKE07306.1 WD40 repeat domain-containing protein [Mesobacillus selenatarsenatis]
MKWIYIITAAAFTVLLSACTFESFESIPKDSSIISTINIKEMTISFYDMEKGEKLPDWAVDRPYIGGLILPDNDTILLYGKSLDTADLYSLSKGKKIASWKTGKGIVNALLVENGAEIAFADQDRDSVRFYNIKGTEVDEIKVEKDPLTLLEAEEKLYAISYNQEMLSIIDTNDKKRLPGFKIHPAAAGALLCREKDELWIGGHGKGTEVEESIHIYDLNNGRLMKEISAPVMPVDFTKDEDDVFVLSHGSNMLYKLGEDGRMKDSLKVGANPFEIDFFADKLIVAGYDSNEVYIIAPDSLSIENTLEVGNGPFQIVTRER